MAGLIIDVADHEKICREYNRIGAFLTAITHIKNEFLDSITEEDYIACALVEKEVISKEERDRVMSHQDPTISKGMVLLDVMLTKESRDAMVMLQFLRDTKQFQLAKRIDEVLKEVERIVDRNVDAVSPTQYSLPIHSMAETHHRTPRPQPDIIGTEDGALKIYPREAWGAEQKRSDSPILKKKLPYVIISHTAQIGNYNTTEECLIGVKEAQQLNFTMGFDDIAFNYLVGNDGAIYEGRGHSHEGATARGWNHRAIGIAFIGRYVTTMPSQAALDAAKAFLKHLKKKGVENDDKFRFKDVLDWDFTIHCLRQVREQFLDAPGDPLFNEIKTWRANDPEGWSWREKDDEEEDNKSDGDALSEESRDKLKEGQTSFVAAITNTSQLLEIIGVKGVLNRFVRKNMKTESKKAENCDEALRQAILNHVFTQGTYQDVQKLIEALVELHQIRVANVMYKLFPAEERKKFNIQQRQRKDIPPYQEIPYQDICLIELHGNGKIPHILGAGRYGKVQLAKMESLGNEPIAVKKLNELEERVIHEFKREAKLQFQLRHKHITKVIGIVCNPTYDHYWIAMEHMANGSLKDLLDKVVIPWPVKVRMMRDIAQALQFMHTVQNKWRDHTVTHGDLKAANILIDEHFIAKISDFGSAVQNYVTSSTGVKHQFDKGGTITHIAPELLQTEESYRPNQKSDMWSFGIILFEVSSENTRGTDDPRVPFYKNPAIKISADIVKNGWNPLTSNNSVQMKKIPLDQCPKVFIEVMFHCCEIDPEKRPNHFRDIANTLHDAYQKEYEQYYQRGLAGLILQDEALMHRPAGGQEPMEQDREDESMEEERNIEVFHVAPLYGPSEGEAFWKN